jgi:hypothetical protein
VSIVRRLPVALLGGALVALVLPELALADNCTGTDDTQNCMAAINFVALATSLAAAGLTGAGVMVGRSLTGVKDPAITERNLTSEDAPLDQKLEKKRRNCEEVAANLRELADEITQRLQQEDERYRMLTKRTSLGNELEAAVHREEERLNKASDAWTTLEVFAFLATLAVTLFPPAAAAEATAIGAGSLWAWLRTTQAVHKATQVGVHALDAGIVGLEGFGKAPTPGLAEGKLIQQYLDRAQSFKKQTDLFVERWEENIAVIDRMISSYKVLHERWTQECATNTTVKPPAPFKEWQRYYYYNYGDPTHGHLVRDPWTGSYQLTGWRVDPPGHKKRTY